MKHNHQLEPQTLSCLPTYLGTYSSLHALNNTIPQAARVRVYRIDLQPRLPLDQRAPLLRGPLHRRQGRHHQQVELRRVQMHTGVREHHVVDQDQRVRTQRGGGVPEDDGGLFVRVVVDDVAHVVDAGAWVNVKVVRSENTENDKLLVIRVTMRHNKYVRTLDSLRLKEILHHGLHALMRNRMLQRRSQILHNNPILNTGRQPLPQQRALGTDPAADIDKQRLIGAEVLDRLTDRVHVQPHRHAHVLGGHEAVEVRMVRRLGLHPEEAGRSVFHAFWRGVFVGSVMS